MVEVYQGFEVAATLFETSVFLDFLTKLLGKKYSDRNQSAIAIIAFLTINTFIISMNLIVPQYSALQDVGVLILYMVYALFFTSGSLIMKIITPALTITSICTINLITVFSLAPLWQLRFSELITERNVQRIIALFLTKAVFFLLTRLTLRNVKPKEIILSIKEYFAVALSFICSVIIILYFTENQYRSNQITLDYSVVIVLFSVVLINIASSVLFAVLVKRNRERTQHMMVEIQFQEQQKMYQSVCSAYRNLEILQHDMKNDLLSLQSLIHQGKLSEAERFVEQYTNTKKKFENSGMSSLSTFVRAMIFEGYIVHIDENELKRLTVLANNIANNINQIAHRANVTNKVYKEDIEEIKELGDKLWRPLMFLQTKVAQLKH